MDEGADRVAVSRAPQPSFVTLPIDGFASLDAATVDAALLDSASLGSHSFDRAPGFPATILSFLVLKFPHIPESEWRARMMDEEIHVVASRSGAARAQVTPGSPYQAGARVSYYRRVSLPQSCPEIPIVFEDDEILVADKPHGISVTPSGKEVGGCLLYLLWDRSPQGQLTPVHRIDRDTAGLVLFVKKSKDRGAWQTLFAEGRVSKLYFASAPLLQAPETHFWRVETHISRPSQTLPVQRENLPRLPSNSCSDVYFCGRDEASGVARFWIRPRTGKQHQIRLHLGFLGFPILGDPVYGRPDHLPLQLLSAELILRHPRDGRIFRFQSSRQLEGWPAKSRVD